MPRIYTNYEAAVMVTKGFELESGNKWVVCMKVVKSNKWYKPIKNMDLTIAEENGWNYICN